MDTAQVNQERITTLFEKFPDGIILVDSQGHILFTNSATEHLLGTRITEIQKRLIHYRLAVNETLHEEIELENNRSVRLEIRIIETDWEGKIAYLLLLRDITAQRDSEETIRRLAFYDPLTDLPNRELLMDRLTHDLNQDERENKVMALMALDLDNFKTINDVLGHSVGDELLKAVSTRLKDCVRKGDTVSRFGGDEFVLILNPIRSSSDVVGVANKILEVFQPPFVIDSQELFVSTSIGVALYPDDARDPQTLMKHADVALSRAKENGRNNYQLFTAGMNSQIYARVELEARLRKSVKREELQIHYQPQVGIKDESITGVEALLRWEHPELGIVPPSRFIPIAEETGIIVQMGEWVLRKACRQNKKWQMKGLPPIRMGVNVSTRQFQQKNFVSMVQRILKETGLEPKYLELEITESILMNHTDDAVRTLKELHRLGVHLSIDDFGTGYSCLSYLQHLPISTLKIDQSFVQEINGHKNNSSIVQAISSLGRNLDLHVIAEGVETEEQLEFIKSTSSHEVQGYFYSKALPETEMTGLLLKGKSCFSP